MSVVLALRVRKMYHAERDAYMRLAMTATLVPLNQIDPADAWQPWHPTSDDPWGRKWAAHLYRRAAFGASPEELVEAERLGPDRTLDLLLQGQPQSADILETLIDVGRVAASRDDGGDQLRGWWLYCMLQGGHPLREKLTLFWHNHFATSLVKVQDPKLMFRQNCLLRDSCLGQVRAIPSRRQPGRSHAALARFQQQRQGSAERELCPRADGAV